MAAGFPAKVGRTLRSTLGRSLRLLNLPSPTNWLKLCTSSIGFPLAFLTWPPYETFFSPVVKLNSTMRQLKKDNETIVWTSTLDQAWEDLLTALEDSSQKFLASYDHELPLCLFADASGHYWGLMLTQCTNCDPADMNDTTPVLEQHHRPIFFLSGKFSSTQLNWHISQKELYPIIFSFKRLPYLMFGHTRRITVFTDHKNLAYIINPEWSPKTAYIDRLIRWGLMLQNADICVRHIKGEDNLASDILSRWGNPFSRDSASTSATALLFLNFTLSDDAHERLFANEEISFQNPWYDGTWQRLTDDEVLEAQRIALADDTLDALHHKKGKIWIPFACLPRLVIHNHIALNHPGLHEELRYLRTFSFELPSNVSLDTIIRGYRAKCMHCQRRPRVLRRALHETPITKIPRRILHADYLYINKASHFLVIVDNATRKVFLKHTATEDAETMALAITEFLGNFQLLPKFDIYTDNGSYFAGRLLEKVSRSLGFSRQFSVQFAPWTNGTVEVTNTKLLKIVRTLCSEFEIAGHEIYKLTGLIMHVLNNSPSPIKANYTPNQLFMDAPVNDMTGLIDRKDLFTVSDGELHHPKNIDNVLDTIDDLRTLMNTRLTEAYEVTLLRRRRQNALYNLRHNAPTLQHQAGDWVLVSKHGTLASRVKDKPMWVGPYQICQATHRNVYEVRDLLGRQRTVHAARIWPYAPSHYQPPPNLLKIFLTDVGPVHVDRILDLKFDDSEFFLLVRWLGFAEEDDTWEPLDSLTEDVPELVGEFLGTQRTSLGKRAYAAYKRLIR